jgi:hypothetical protein
MALNWDRHRYEMDALKVQAERLRIQIEEAFANLQSAMEEANRLRRVVPESHPSCRSNLSKAGGATDSRNDDVGAP